MPRRIEGVTEKLIEAARQEFLENGFEGASIRTIAAKAETSPRAVYTRFENKEELFQAVIGTVYDGFMDIFREDKIIYWEEGRKVKDNVTPEVTPKDFYVNYLKYAYTNKEDFMLLLTGSKGTKYEFFTRELAELDIQGLYENIRGVKKKALKIFVENITYSFYDMLFDPFIRGVNLKTAVEYTDTLVEFYTQGILKVYDEMKQSTT